MVSDRHSGRRADREVHGDHRGADIRVRRVEAIALQLLAAQSSIVSCERCPRLRAYCQRVGREKRRAFRDDTYWARPVPGFGDPHARLLMIGLAPAAHGANRTGRVFTGDGVGASGDFLMAALHLTGFANIPTSRDRHDGLTLTDAFIAAAVRCAPPDNTPTTEEILNCLPHLEAETAALPHVRVIVALGRTAFDAYLRLLKRRGITPRPRPTFSHGATTPLPDGRVLIGSFHPSRQNTNTGKLTPQMMADVFRLARHLLDAEHSLVAGVEPDVTRRSRVKSRPGNAAPR